MKLICAQFGRKQRHITSVSSRPESTAAKTHRWATGQYCCLHQRDG